MDKKTKKLILIDGNAIIHRAYHALPPLTTKKGELVNAVYGFSSTILSVIEKFKPDYIIATFDLSGPTFRHKEFQAYKAHRIKADQELYDQIPRVKEVVRAMGIPILEREGYEADDVIGAVVKYSEEKDEDLENIIVTGDLDTLQLVSPRTRVYSMRRGITDSVLYDEAAVFERYQLKPEQLIDFKGLRGDPSDNIPGVKGIGEKTAIELLKNYETLENVYVHIGEIKGAIKDRLERDKVQAIQSKKLATIEKNVPVEIKLDDARVHDFEREKLVKLFQELNFFSLIKRLPGPQDNEVAKLHNNHKNAKIQNSDGVKDFKYEYIKAEDIERFLAEIGKEKEVSIALNANSDDIFDENFKIQGVVFSWKTGRAGYVEFSEIKNQISRIKKIIENENIIKIGYNLKTAIKALEKYDIEVKAPYCDVMLEAYVLDPGGKIEFPTLVMSELCEEIPDENKKGQLGLQMESSEETAQKFCRKADYIFKLKKALEKKIEEISSEQKAGYNLEYVLQKLEQPLIPILSQMEIFGVRLNKVIFRGIAQKIDQRIESLERNIHELAGGPFNINSPKQLTDILFGKLQLPTIDIKKGKTGFSTASSELKKIQDKHKIVGKIEEYREIFKLKTTYLDALPSLCDQNSRIHTTFNQAITATGRLSSSDPNLQNIPIRTELGQILRTAFEAEKGYKLIAADYSQIDLRVVAHVSGDKKMIELFRRGEDIHQATAAEINKVTLPQVTKTMRRRAKELNFGVIYGMSVFGFSERTGIDREEAKKFIDAYFERFSGVAQYMKDIKEYARTHGYVETEMGRRRYIPEINSPNFQVVNSAERMAINMPIQGLSADIVKLAMIRIYEYITNENRYSENEVRMILQVHDEIILEVKENLAEEVGRKVKEIMESAYKLSVPLVVDVKTGDNWVEI